MSEVVMRRARAAALAVLCGAVGCSTARHAKPTPPPATPVVTEVPTPVVVPTVPPSTPAPSGAAPLPTRPVKNPEAEAEKRAGKAIGPVVTFAGIARADGQHTEPVGKNAQGETIF